jgi:hypothetical protein
VHPGSEPVVGELAHQRSGGTIREKRRSGNAARGVALGVVETLERTEKLRRGSVSVSV